MHVIFHFTQIENEENNYLFPEITGSTKLKKKKNRNQNTSITKQVKSWTLSSFQGVKSSVSFISSDCSTANLYPLLGTYVTEIPNLPPHH